MEPPKKNVGNKVRFYFDFCRSNMIFYKIKDNSNFSQRVLEECLIGQTCNLELIVKALKIITFQQLVH